MRLDNKIESCPRCGMGENCQIAVGLQNIKEYFEFKRREQGLVKISTKER